MASQTATLASIQFTLAPKTGSVTRPLSGTYAHVYLAAHGYLKSATGQILLPIYGLYAGYTNRVTLTYRFADGSSKTAQTSISTTSFSDPCGYTSPTKLQARTGSTSLSYDFLMIKGTCSSYSPAIIDTDGSLRWVGTAGLFSFDVAFFDNAVYIGSGAKLYRNDLDGTVTMLADYSANGVSDLHHNIDPGKSGLLLEADTPSQVESLILEVDGDGKILKQWDMGAIISAAMTAGGDNPNQFVHSAPNDWFHSNAVTYHRADNSLVVSSRENFVIAIDYDTKAIKWILGDPTKKWHSFSSLRQFALTVPAGGVPPIGQHGISISYDQKLLLFDNGQASASQMPSGAQRNYASPREYRLDLTARTATEVWNYEMNQSVYSPYCGSVYEDAPLNYLIDYAVVNGPNSHNPYAQLIGLDAAGAKIFHYQYPTVDCNTAFNSISLHLEKTAFPTVGPQPLNLSTRGQVSSGDDTLIAGFIISGNASKTVVLRALGPSLADAGLTNAVQNPALTVYNSAGVVIAENDDWQTGASASALESSGLAPHHPTEAATIHDFAPGGYTAVVSKTNGNSGIGLVEAYDLSLNNGSAALLNLSTRGLVGRDDNALISGFIVGQVHHSSVLIRALGPSLAASHVGNSLADPMLTIFDRNGAAIAANDNWANDVSASAMQSRHLAPTNAAEAATILDLPAGAYTAIVNGVGGATGVALVEFYHLQ